MSGLCCTVFPQAAVETTASHDGSIRDDSRGVTKNKHWKRHSCVVRFYKGGFLASENMYNASVRRVHAANVFKVQWRRGRQGFIASFSKSQRHVLASHVWPSDSLRRRLLRTALRFRCSTVLADLQDFHQVQVAETGALVQHPLAFACLVPELLRQTALLIG